MEEKAALVPDAGEQVPRELELQAQLLSVLLEGFLLRADGRDCLVHDGGLPGRVGLAVRGGPRRSLEVVQLILRSLEAESQELLLGHPLGFVELAALRHELPDLRVPDALGQHELLLELLDQLLLVGGLPRSLALDHLVKDHPQGKDVGLAGVVGLEYGLRRHVERRADVDAVLEAVLGLDCEPEVRDLPLVACVGAEVPILRMLAGFRSRCMMFCPLR